MVFIKETKIFKKSLINGVLISLLGILLIGCVPATNSSKKSKSNSEESNTETPTNQGGTTTNQPSFNKLSSFIDDGSNQSYGIFQVNIDSGLNLLLRGQESHTYLSQTGKASEVLCLVSRINEGTTNKWLVLAASPGQLYNYQSATKELYFSINLNNENVNRTFCQKSGLITELSNQSPLDSISYSLTNICTSCTNGYFNTGLMSLYLNSGSKISSVDISGLRFKFKNTPTVVSSGNSCTSSSQCTGSGYDCCGTQGFCINDKSLKQDINQSSSEFLQAQNDISQNPANILNYPNFYYLCPIVVDNSDDDEDEENTASPEELAAAHFSHLSDLYNCTTMLKGEMSICTTSIENATTASQNVFFTEDDDRNFKSTYSGTTILKDYSIVEVNHAGEILFKDDVFLKPNEVKIGANNSLLGNDSLTDPGIIELNRTLPQSATNDTLNIKYKIDGSCEVVSSQVAKCTKYYTQGQNSGDVDDHFPASNSFILPNYIDLNKNITVEVDGTLKFIGTHWNVNTTSGLKIDFLGNSLQVFDQQVVAINYFVDLSANNVLNSKRLALEEIKQMCGCADLNCKLKPDVNAVNGQDVITTYICDYPDAVLDKAPIQQVIMLSSKTVPMRFYDENGAAHSQITLDTADQEGQEFKYTNGDLLRPNNVDKYIGMNEVYGSLSKASSSAKPAKEVRVDNGKVYDIYVDTGTFSSCFNCGLDYHSRIAKLFPANFLHKGGGWSPLEKQTNRKSSTEFRADDVLFGRACFVPATMIPYTHYPDTQVQKQRLSRLEAQHFFFANGYNRDWFGFDYGSLIGSFDGVKWFSIGNQRRIKAEGHKLFLAINAYFGDLTLENTYQITVVDSTISNTSVGTIQSDFKSDGAQCQKHHVCSNDNDCATNLGWEYKCENVNQLTSNWPVFDSLANELPESEEKQRLYSLFKASAGGAKRCVYRGRGAACHKDMTFPSESLSFNGTTSTGLISCSQNTYCQKFIEGSQAKVFNSQIARYGKDPLAQNFSSYVPGDSEDTFGLHTRFIGRPYDYIASQEIRDEALNNLSYNNVVSICLPGKNPEETTVSSANSRSPASAYQGDKVLNMGMTFDSQQDSRFLSSCPVIDADENYYHFKDTNINATLDTSVNTELYNLTAAQNYSTSHLAIFESILGTKLTEVFESKQITQLALEKNRCLRAPGSSCFTDLDCSHSDYVNKFVLGVNANDVTTTSIINKNEILFWQEKLVCSQETAKTDEAYDHTNNRCCREIGKKITIPTFTDQQGYSASNTDDSLVDFDNTSIPGIDISLSDKKRYSRNSVVHYERSKNTSLFPTLENVGKNKCEEGGCQSTDIITNQYKTLDLYAAKTCCNGNWVRSFHEDNGGGHRWAPSKMQTFNKKNLKCYNWAPYTASSPADAQPFTCSHVDDPNDFGCEIRNLSEPLYKPVLELMSEIELLGVPQATIKSSDADSMSCSVNQDDQFAAASDSIVRGVLSNEATSDINNKGEYIDSDGNVKLSAVDSSNFSSDLKNVFAADELSCCLPAGTDVEVGANKDMCCTGFIDESNNKCALPDFTDLSVYFNRYISSAAKGLSDSLFDPNSGYFKNVSTAVTLACQKQVCASRTIAFGVGVSQLAVPGHEDSAVRFKRFIDGDDNEVNNKNGLADLFNSGLKWNNHAYCVPADIVASPDIIVTQCQ